jgi:acyl-coenzyme A synthetase/AMP-(fatty) acid ligase
MIKLPLPPISLTTFYQDDNFLKEKHITVPGYYDTGDMGYFDEEGLLFVEGRSDFEVKFGGFRMQVTQIEDFMM